MQPHFAKKDSLRDSKKDFTFETLKTLPLSRQGGSRSAQLKPFKPRVEKNDGEYFNVYKNKSLVKERDKDIQEIIDGAQLSNTTFVVEIDDFKELDSFVTLLDPTSPKDITIYNTEYFPKLNSTNTKPSLVIKAFKFQFDDNEMEETPAYEKHQYFSTKLNEIYAKAVKYLKEDLYDEKDNQRYKKDNIGKHSKENLKKKSKHGASNKDKSPDTLEVPRKEEKKIVVTSFKVFFNVDDKNEVHVLIHCMAWKANDEWVVHHNEELDYLEREDVFRETLDIDNPDKSQVKETKEPFSIRNQNMFLCFFWRKKKAIKKEKHGPLESLSDIDIFIPSYVPGRKIVSYDGYIDSHLFIQIDK